MGKVIVRDFIHSTHGVLCLVLVATVMLGALFMVGGRLAEPAVAASVTEVSALVESAREPQRALAHEGTRIPVVSSLVSSLVASDPDTSSTSWYDLALSVCKKLIQAGYL